MNDPHAFTRSMYDNGPLLFSALALLITAIIVWRGNGSLVSRRWAAVVPTVGLLLALGSFRVLEQARQSFEQQGVQRLALNVTGLGRVQAVVSGPDAACPLAEEIGARRVRVRFGAAGMPRTADWVTAVSGERAALPLWARVPECAAGRVVTLVLP